MSLSPGNLTYSKFHSEVSSVTDCSVTAILVQHSLLASVWTESSLINLSLRAEYIFVHEFS